MELINPISKEKLRVYKSKMSVDDIVAWCREHDALRIDEPLCTPDAVVTRLLYKRRRRQRSTCR